MDTDTTLLESRSKNAPKRLRSLASHHPVVLQTFGQPHPPNTRPHPHDHRGLLEAGSGQDGQTSPQGRDSELDRRDIRGESLYVLMWKVVDRGSDCMYFQLGLRHPHFGHSKEVPVLLIQDLWSRSTGPEANDDTALFQPQGEPVVSQ